MKFLELKSHNVDGYDSIIDLLKLLFKREGIKVSATRIEDCGYMYRLIEFYYHNVHYTLRIIIRRGFSDLYDMSFTCPYTKQDRIILDKDQESINSDTLYNKLTFAMYLYNDVIFAIKEIVVPYINKCKVIQNKPYDEIFYELIK